MILTHRSIIGSTFSAFSGGNIGTARSTPISARRFTLSTSSPRPNVVTSAGLLRHLPEFWQFGSEVATCRGNPAIAIADCATGAVRKRTSDMDWRVGLGHGVWPRHHRIELDELPVILGLVFHPDLLHRLDGLPHALETGGVYRSVVLHFILVPATADPEQETTSADLIYGRHKLGCLNSVALLHKQHASAELDSFRCLACGG